MKKIALLTLLILFQFKAVKAQDSISSYFNENWKTCKKKDAAYFRVKHKNGNYWLVKDYYVSGEIQMIGTYANKKCTIKEGDFYSYYKSGQIERKVAYKNNLLDGQTYGYYQDGSLSEDGEYKNGKKNGLFKFYYTTGTVSWYEQYNMDSLVLRECWNEKGQEMDPEFPPHVDAFIAGGTRSLYFLVEENFSYPNEVKGKNLTIEVEVVFNVSKEGKISAIKVIGSKEAWIEKEIIRVFSLMPKWYPALDHMRPVDSEVTIPLLFKHLAEGQKK